MNAAASPVVLVCESARVEILASVGANVSRWSIGDREILSSPPDAAALAHSPARYGIPVLFPFPNRIRGGKYEFEGRSHTWAPIDGEGNAKHGFVLREPWDIVAQSTESATLSLDVGSRPHLLAMYPFPCRIELRATLGAHHLALEFSVTNTGKEKLPMGFGIHPYFTLPLSIQGSRATTSIRVPAREEWVLEAMIPTGARRPVTGKLDLREGLALGGEGYDHVLTELDGDSAEIVDPASGRRVILEAARKDGFHDWVVYAPPDRDVVALEPYTCPTDALNLAARGIDAALILLEPGASWHAPITLRAT